MCSFYLLEFFCQKFFMSILARFMEFSITHLGGKVYFLARKLAYFASAFLNAGQVQFIKL